MVEFFDPGHDAGTGSQKTTPGSLLADYLDTSDTTTHKPKDPDQHDGQETSGHTHVAAKKLDQRQSANKSITIPRLEIDPKSGTGADQSDQDKARTDIKQQYSIKLDAPPLKYVWKQGDTVQQVARKQLGHNASQKDVEIQASLITNVNSDSAASFTPQPGDTLLLPGHTKAGDILFKDHWGTQYAAHPDDTVTVTYSDHTGFKSSTDKDGNTIKEYFGPSKGDNYTVKLDTNGIVISNDRVNPLDRQAGKLEDERATLEKLVDTKMGIAEERDEFKQRMHEFEQRAKDDGVSDKEVTQTYAELSRILGLTGTQPLTHREHQRLALGIIRGAAEPTNNDQGEYNTCSVADGVENRLYITNPSIVARTLANIATAGKFVSTTGTIVRMEPGDLRAHGDADFNEPPGLGCRTYASQIFQLAAANAFYTEHNQTIPPQEWRYAQVKPSGDDDGERLINYRTIPPAVDYELSAGISSSVNGVIETYYLISGKYLPETVLVNQEEVVPGKSDLGNIFQTKDDLRAKLTELKQQGKLPAAVRVDYTSDPFYRKDLDLQGHKVLEHSYRSQDDFIDGDHYVYITDFDEKTGQVKVDNSWVKDFAWLKHPMTVDELYEASYRPDCKTWLDRIGREHGREPQSEYAKQLENVMLAYINLWKQSDEHGRYYNHEDPDRSIEKFHQLLATLGQKNAERIGKHVDAAWNTWQQERPFILEPGEQ